MIEWVKKIFPTFPDDRTVQGTFDVGRFYRIDYTTKTLYIPALKALKANIRLLDPTTDALRAFMVADLSKVPDWSLLRRIDDKQDEDAAMFIIRDLISIAQDSVDPLVMSADIETPRIELRNSRILAIGFCCDEYLAYEITTFTTAILSGLQVLFNHPNIRWIWQNGKFDTLRLKWFLDLDARVDEDTMLMHYIGINEKRGTHGLKELGMIFCQAPAWEDELNLIKKSWATKNGVKLSEFTYDMFPREVLLKYLMFDVVVTRRLYFILKSLMREGTEFIYRKLVEASNVYRQVELNGITLDIDYLEELEYELDTEIEQAADDLSVAVRSAWDPLLYMKQTGAKSNPGLFNMKSPKQLKWLIERVVGRTIENTSKEVLGELFDEVGDKFPVISAIRDIRKLTKYMDTYVQGLREIVTADGKIHCTYNLHGTETGRLSSSDPNMQNIPRDSRIKNLFVASPGCKLVSLDYSQAELRVLAYLSRDEFLTQVYLEGRDLHDAVAEGIYGPDFTKEQRVGAKTVNFGIVYGVGPGRISKTQKISFQAAKELMDGWYKNAPQAKAWIQHQRAMVHKGESPTTLFGRERRFVLTDDNLNALQNECTNFPVQSIASDLTMLSLLQIQEWIDDAKLRDRVRICVTVHDSIVLECVDSYELIDRVVSTGRGIMEAVPQRYLTDYYVPFKADAEVGYSWGEMEAYNV